MRFAPMLCAALLAAGCTMQDGNDAPPPPADSGAMAGAGPDTMPAPPPPPAQPLPPPPPPAGGIPERFQGDYAVDAAACTSPGHPSQLTIGASRIEFHESSGEITRVHTTGNRIDITATLTGEGETREARYRFHLSADGRTLTDTVHGMARQRCD